ncbi:MAG TPA: hypothetical protein ENI77_00750 [Nitrospirae bacterium]|nr:hypothetical protein [Nitrospirota bacterium]
MSTKGVKSKNTRDVFINIPFDDKYEPLYLALIAGLTGLGMVPRCVVEIPSHINRLQRIFDLIKECPFPIHDLSRVQLSKEKPRCPRFNMPFELGLAVSVSLGSYNHSWIVFESENRRILKSLSDLNGFDPYIHRGKSSGVLRELRNAFVEGSFPHPDVKSLTMLHESLVRYSNIVRKEDHLDSLYERNVFKQLVVYSQKEAKAKKIGDWS